jgi:hypothetical protein
VSESLKAAFCKLFKAFLFFTVTLMLVDELLESLKAAFLKLFKDAITALPAPSQTYEFDSDFQRVMQVKSIFVCVWI